MSRIMENIIYVLIVLFILLAGSFGYWALKTKRQIMAKFETLAKTSHREQREAKDEIIRRVNNTVLKERRVSYSQIESLFMVDKLVAPKAPLPTMGGWAISPDSAVILARLVKEHKFKNLVDLGSGTSSIIMGYILNQNGIKGAKVLSVDHESSFAAQTEANLREHGLTDRVSVVVAPLKKQKIGGKQYDWYDLTKTNLKDIDFVFVDGPPGKLQEHSRYSAIPFLYDKLSKDAVIMVDDYDRDDERWMVKEWIKAYPDLVLEELITEKGIAILRRRNNKRG